MSAAFKYIDPAALPEEWTADHFGNLVDFNLGRTPPRGSPIYWNDGKYPWVSISDMTPNGLITDTAEKVSQQAYDSIFRGKLVPEGSLLMSFKLTIGRMSRLGIPAFHNEAIISFQPSPEEISPEYLSYYLSQINYKYYQDTAIKGQTLNKGKLNSLEIALPPLPEQKKIAHVLSMVQRAIEAQERIIQTTTELKKALMHKLFTEGLRNEPQKQTDIGPIPESWEVVPLNQLADLKNGYAFKSKDYVAESNTLNIRMSNIRPGAQFDLEYNPRFLPDRFAESLKSFLLEDGDLIIAMTDMANDPKILGVPTIVRNPSDKKLLLNQRVGKLVPTDNSSVNFEFLRFYLSRKPAQRYLISCAKKGVQVNIGKKDILSVPIAFPKPDEQKTIVQCFNNLDDKQAVAQHRVTALQDLFRTLLHELMTAKTRVHRLEFSTLTTAANR